MVKGEVQAVNSAYKEVKQILESARNTVYRTANFAMVVAYWQIGGIIVENEQKGRRAEYGKYLIKGLSQKLTKNYGRGFDVSNLKYMRLFYLKFPIGDALRHQFRSPTIHHALRHKFKSQKFHAMRGKFRLPPIQDALRPELSWTHYRSLLKVKNKNAMDFYMHEAANSNWSTRALDRQINSLLYERLALSKNKKKVRQLATKGQVVQKPEDLIKDPYVLEFLGIKENNEYLEKDLEKLLLDKLKDFLLELGKGFSFVARQKRIDVEGDNYYIDLVFYNYILKCFVLIDLKVGKLTPQDIGQMDFYMRYYEEENKQGEDNPTIGLVLCSDKDDAMVKYTLLKESRTLFASKYKLYLPTEEELKRELLQWRGSRDK